MRVAIPIWQESVSPVLDVARMVVLADIEAGVVKRRRLEPVSDTGVLARATRLRALAVDALICGAVSRPLEQALVSSGIQVIPHVCGNVDEVLDAYLAGHLRDRAFLMPGCGDLHRQTRDPDKMTGVDPRAGGSP